MCVRGDADHHGLSPLLRAATREALALAGRARGEAGHINAHGTSTVLNDAVEATAIRELYATGHGPSATSAKGVLGHTMGAAGAIEAALTVLSVARGTVPPTANFTAPDAATAGIDVVRADARPQRVGLVLSHSPGFGGHTTVLAFTAL